MVRIIQRLNILALACAAVGLAMADNCTQPGSPPPPSVLACIDRIDLDAGSQDGSDDCILYQFGLESSACLELVELVCRGADESWSCEHTGPDGTSADCQTATVYFSQEDADGLCMAMLESGELTPCVPVDAVPECQSLTERVCGIERDGVAPCAGEPACLQAKMLQTEASCAQALSDRGMFPACSP